jgi:acetyl-CoA C-acetyltransferase
MNGILHDPWQKFHMGVTAEERAKRYGIGRVSQDELAAESQQRASQAIAEGRFADQIAPIVVPSRKQAIEFKTPSFSTCPTIACRIKRYISIPGSTAIRHFN